MKRTNALKAIYQSIDTGTAQEKMRSLPPFPKIVEFEITNHCNYQCIMCPTGVGTARRERGYMSEEIFDRVVSELAEYVPNVAMKFVGQGEPLLHPHAIDYIIRAHNSGIVTHLTTNASLLTEEMTRHLVATQALDSIKFSFQGIDAEGYQMLRQKDGFEDLMHRIGLFYEIRGGREKPYMTIGTSVTNEKTEEIESFQNRAQKICDRVEVGQTQLVDSALFLVDNVSYREKLSLLRDRQVQNTRRYRCCPQVYDVITVRWNGDITACCADIHGEMTLGNISDMLIRDCWDSEKEQAYRQILAEGRYDDLDVCRTCYDAYGWTYGDN